MLCFGIGVLLAAVSPEMNGDNSPILPLATGPISRLCSPQVTAPSCFRSHVLSRLQARDALCRPFETATRATLAAAAGPFFPLRAILRSVSFARQYACSRRRVAVEHAMDIFVAITSRSASHATDSFAVTTSMEERRTADGLIRPLRILGYDLDRGLAFTLIM